MTGKITYHENAHFLFEFYVYFVYVHIYLQIYTVALIQIFKHFKRMIHERQMSTQNVYLIHC